MVGAIIGATPTINIKVENIFAISEAGNKSLTIARLTTIPTQPPRAKITLININWLIDVDNAQWLQLKIKAIQKLKVLSDQIYQ